MMGEPQPGLLQGVDRRISSLESRFDEHVRICLEETRAMRVEFREMREANDRSHQIVLGKIDGLAEKLGDERDNRTNGWIKALGWALAGLLGVIGYLLAQGLPWAK